MAVLLLGSLLLASSWASVAICQQALATDLNQTLPILLGRTHDPAAIKALERFTFTGKSYNDLGHYSTCLHTPDSTYFILRHKLEHLSLLLGVCVPSACTQDDLEMMFAGLIQQLELTGVSVKVEAPAEFPMNGWFVFTLLWLVVLVVLGIVASYVDIRQEHFKATAITFKGDEASQQLIPRPRESLGMRVLKCFSLYTNTKKLFLSRSAEKTGNVSTLECLNGVRVLSMTWVVGGHVWAFRAASAFINYEEVQRVIARWWVFLAYGAFFAVDSFFWLSGLLMSYLTLVELNKRKGKMPLIGWAFIYIHRYFRILPLYVFCLLTYMYLVPPLGSGPLWGQIRNMTLECEQYWWTNLLFINNFVPNGVGNVCFGIGWYLANDMQCFWLAPLLVWMYYKLSKKYTWITSAALLLFCVVVTIVIVVENNFNTMFIASENEAGDFHRKIYVKPYCRLGPYVLGLYTGYIYFHYMVKYEGLESHTRKDPLANAILHWIKETSLGKYISFGLGLSLIFFFIFIQYSAYEDWENSYHTWSKAQNAMFIATEHIGFALGLMLIMLPLLFGEFQAIWWLLAHPVWTPFARLTFSCFMGHYCLMTFVYASEDYGVVFNQLVFYTDWVYAAVMSWLFAFPLSLLVEVPFGHLEKIACEVIRGGGKREAQSQDSS